MRTGKLRITTGLVLFASMGIAVWFLVEWAAATATRDRAEATFVRVGEQASELEALRAELRRNRISAAGHRANALAEVADTIAASGLPEDALRSLDEQNDVDLAEAGLRRQTLRLELASITPGELGVFFARLHADRPHWTVTRVELNRPSRAEGNSYDTTVLMVRTYQPRQRRPEPMEGSP